MDLESISIKDLIRVCIETGDESAWGEFISRSQGVIAATVIRTCRGRGPANPDLIEDLVQTAYVKIWASDCRILRDFKEQHADSFFGLLKSMAFSVVQDHFRSGRAEKRGAG